MNLFRESEPYALIAIPFFGIGARQPPVAASMQTRLEWSTADIESTGDDAASCRGHDPVHGVISNGGNAACGLRPPCFYLPAGTGATRKPRRLLRWSGGFPLAGPAVGEPARNASRRPKFAKEPKTVQVLSFTLWPRCSRESYGEVSCDGRRASRTARFYSSWHNRDGEGRDAIGNAVT